MYDFTERLRADAKTLAKCREAIEHGPKSPDTVNELRACSHKLSGAAGVFGYAAVSSAAAAVEKAVEELVDEGAQDQLAAHLDALLRCIELACLPADKQAGSAMGWSDQ